MAADDLVDHVDEHDNVLEVVTRAEMRARNLRHRAVFILVFTSAGDLVVHRRADWKDVAPGWWDIAFGGVLDAGEAWDDAAVRELAEEAGVAAPLTEVARGTWRDDTDDVEIIGRVYECVHDGPYPCPDGEVVALETIAVADLAGWIAGRQVCPDSIALAAARLGLHTTG